MKNIGSHWNEASAERFGPYIILERLGIGGMATVHRAIERGIENFERTVALKRLLPHLAENADFVRSFVREAKLASRLQHANICQLYELGRVGPAYFISMEYIDGHDVRQLLRQARRMAGPPPIHVVVGLLSQLCDALDYAHNCTDEDGVPLGLVHRDVSPSNLLVAHSGHLKIIDFGIAKANSQKHASQTDRVKGKLAYMSPEAIEGAALDARSDIFSTGIIAYELLTAEPLFASTTDYDTITRVRNMEVRPPSEINPNTPPELDAIVLRSLAKRREDRWESAAAFRDALDALCVAHRLNAAHREVAAWMQSAFSLGRARTESRFGDSSPVSGSRSGPHRAATQAGRDATPLPAPIPLAAETGSLPAAGARRAASSAGAPASASASRRASDDDLVIDIAWGGDDAGVPVLLDEVPDVSDKVPAAPVDDFGPLPTLPGLGAEPTPEEPFSVLDQAVAAADATQVGEAPAAAQAVAVPVASRQAAVFDIPPLPGKRRRRRRAARPDKWANGTHPPPLAGERTAGDDEAALLGAEPGAAPAAGSGTEAARAASVFGATIVDRGFGLGPKLAIGGAVAMVAVAGLLFASAGHSRQSAKKPAAPQAASQGTLKFLLEPVDATIAIDNHKVHTGSPFSVKLKAGTHTIAVTRNGYRSWVSPIEVDSGQTQIIRAALEPGGDTVARVSVRSSPAHLHVRLDGQPLTGTTPLSFEVQPGPHTIVVRGHGRRRWKDQFNAAANTRYSFQPVLTGAAPQSSPATASAAPQSSPAAAGAPVAASAQVPRAGAANNTARAGAATAATAPAAGTTSSAATDTASSTGSAAATASATAKPSATGAGTAAAPPSGPATLTPQPAVTSLTATAALSPLPVAAARTAPARQTQAKQHRTSAIVIRPSEATKVSGALPRLSTGSKSARRVTVKLCTDARGRVVSVTLLTHLPPAAAPKLHDALGRWRYRPYLEGGRPVPVCFAPTFKFPGDHR